MCPCGNPLPKGSGRNNAKRCLDCWAEIIVRNQAGEQANHLAKEFGVSNVAIYYKVQKYGRGR